jgi:hypothetical protein
MSNRQLTGPDRFWIMFDQAWRRINLWEFLLRDTYNRAIVIENDRSRTGCALIQG